MTASLNAYALVQSSAKVVRIGKNGIDPEKTSHLAIPLQ